MIYFPFIKVFEQIYVLQTANFKIRVERIRQNSDMHKYVHVK